MGHGSKKIVTVGLHLLFWVIYGTFLLNFYSMRSADPLSILRIILLMAPQAIIVYLNIFVLMPRLYASKRYLVYILLSIVIIILVFVLYRLIEEAIAEFIRNNFPPPSGDGGHGSKGSRKMWYKFLMVKDMIYVAFTTALYLLSIVYNLAKMMIEREREAVILRSENLNSELKFLKSQINPHFLFNALNNIYALSVIKSDKTPSTLLKLSEMLRYIIYDCKDDHVPLGKEIAYIKNYIDLQLLKDSEGSDVRVDFDVENDQVTIAPMVLIPFIENSFKHSNLQAGGTIDIKLKQQGNQLDFVIWNSRNASVETKDKIGGIGLENVQKRLDLIYPGMHEFKIFESEDQFRVTLVIKFLAQ